MTTEQDPFQAEREKLLTIKAAFEHAVNNNNIEDMRAHTHPDFTFVSFTDKSFDDFDAFKQQWNLTRQQMVGTGNFSTQMNPGSTIFVDDIAIAHGNADNTMLNAQGREYQFSNHWTVIFQRQDGNWKVLRAHSSLDPFGNPMLIDGVKRQIAKYSLISFVTGAVLCGLIGYLMG